MLMRVKQAIENVGGNVVGVVLNNVDARSDSQYQYYTSYYTYYTPSNAAGPTVATKPRKTKSKKETSVETSGNGASGPDSLIQRIAKTDTQNRDDDLF
jgi:hypothetical protein